MLKRIIQVLKDRMSFNRKPQFTHQYEEKRQRALLIMSKGHCSFDDLDYIEDE